LASVAISIELSALSPKCFPKLAVMGGDLPSACRFCSNFGDSAHNALHFFQCRLGMPFSIELSALSPKFEIPPKFSEPLPIEMAGTTPAMTRDGWSANRGRGIPVRSPT
jgi:hypothetical protein